MKPVSQSTSISSNFFASAWTSPWPAFGSRLWRTAQDWTCPLFNWTQAVDEDARFFLQLQQDSSYHQNRDWRRVFKQQLKDLSQQIIRLYQQGAILSLQHLQESLVAQQASFTPSSVSPFYYQSSLHSFAKRLPLYAAAFAGAAAQLKAHLQRHPQEAIVYFYQDVINQLLDCHQRLAEPNTYLNSLMAYYHGLIPEAQWQKTNDLLAHSEHLEANPYASTARHYQKLLQAVNKLFAPELEPQERTALTAISTSISAIPQVANVQTALMHGWQTLKDHPTSVFIGTLLGASAAYGWKQDNSLNLWGTAEAIVPAFAVPSLMTALPYAAQSLSLGLTTYHYAKGLPAWKAGLPFVMGLSTQLVPTTAQVAPAERWIRTLGGTGDDFSMSIQQTSDSGYILAGYTNSFGAGGNDFLLSKWTANGMLSWARTLGGTGYDDGRSVQQTSDRGYVVAGRTNSFGAGITDLWLSKWYANGTLTWVRTLGGLGEDEGHSVQHTSDGGYIVVGHTLSFGAGGADLWLSKWTADGTLSWAKTLGGTGSDFGSYVQLTNDGGYIVTGYTTSFGDGSNDLWLSKWTGDGMLSWVRTLGGTSDDISASVQQTSDGGYIVAGYTNGFGASHYDLWLTKWTMGGALSWARILGGTGYDEGQSVQQTSDGGFIVAGTTSILGSGYYDLWLSKWTAGGTLSWARTLGGTGHTSGRPVRPTSDDGFIVAGTTSGFGAGSNDLLLSKWDSQGSGGKNGCITNLSVTSTTLSISPQSLTLTPSTLSVAAQNLVVSAQIINPTVNTVCNYAPVINNSRSSFIYTENDLATVIDNSLTVSDENALVNATIAISSGFTRGEDLLGFTEQDGINGSYNNNTGVLTLNGTSSAANYQAALRTVTYLNLSENPSTNLRTLSFTVNDGLSQSDVVAYSATVVSVNDLPVLTRNQLTVNLGKSVTLTTNNLNATDIETAASSLQFTVSNINYGQFERITAPRTPIVTFSQQDIMDDYISFNHDGSNNAPAYNVRVSDGTSTTTPTPASINFISPTTSNSMTTQATSTSTANSNSESVTSTRSGQTSAVTTTTASTSTESSHSLTKATLDSSTTDEAAITEGNQDNLPLLIGAIAGGTIGAGLLLSLIAWLIRKRQLLNAIIIEPGPVLKDPRLGKGYTLIKGGRYALINKITEAEATLLLKQEGIEVTFPEGKKKAKFMLGQGQFGKLRIAREVESLDEFNRPLAWGRFVGVKKIKGEAQIAASQNEATLQKQLAGCAHIMPLLDSVETKGSEGQPVLYQFMPLAGFGNGDYVKALLASLTDETLKAQLLVHIARGLLTGLAQMHAKGFYHLDLKPANFVLHTQGEVFIIDFGCTVQSENPMIDAASGDTRYYSPDRIANWRRHYHNHNLEAKEMLEQFDATKADTWALGLTLLELATNAYPFEDANKHTKLEQWDSAYFQAKFASIEALQNPHLKGYWAVIKGLLDTDPEQRLSADEALELPVFKQKEIVFNSQTDCQGALARLKTQPEISLDWDTIGYSHETSNAHYEHDYGRTPVQVGALAKVEINLEEAFDDETADKSASYINLRTLSPPVYRSGIANSHTYFKTPTPKEKDTVSMQGSAETAESKKKYSY